MILKAGSNKKSMAILSSLILMVCVVLFSKFVFGEQTFLYRDIAGDAVDYAFPMYSSIINKIQTLDFTFWDPSYGYGADILVNQIFIFDIFGVPIILGGLLLGIEKIGIFYVVSAILRILFSGIVFYKYLSMFKISENSKIIWSLIYSLNGFAIVWGQQAAFATCCVIFPLFLLSLEKCRDNKKNYIFLIVLSCYSMIFSVYQSYMFFLLSGIYVCFQYFYYNEQCKIKEFITYILPRGISILIGILLSTFISLTVIYTMFNISGRLASDVTFGQKLLETLKSLYPTAYYKSLLLRLFSNNLEGIGFDYTGYGNYFEGITLFGTMLMVFIVPQYLYGLLVKKRKVEVVSMIVVISLLLLPITSMAINGFAYPFSRHSFLVLPFIFLACSITLDKIIIEKQFNIIIAIFTCIGAIGILFYKYFSVAEKEFSKAIQFGIIVNAVLLICLAAMFIYSKRKIFKPFFIAIILLIVITNNIVESFPTLNFRTFYLKDHPIFYEHRLNDDVADALNFLKEYDTSFYRVEKDFSDISIDGDSLIQRFNGVSTYNIMNNKDVHTFMNNFWPEMIPQGMPSGSKHNFRLQINNIQGPVFSNVKYLLSIHHSILLEEQYDEINSFGMVRVLKMKEPSNLGIFYTNFISENDYFELDNLSRGHVLSNTVVVDEFSPLLETPNTFKTDSDKLDTNNDIIMENALRVNDFISDFSYFPEEIRLEKDGEDSFFEIPINTDRRSKIDCTIYVEMLVNVVEIESMQIFFDVGNDYEEVNSTKITVYPKEDQLVQFVLPENTKSLRIDFDNNQQIELSNIRLFSYKDTYLPQTADVIFNAQEKSTEIKGSITTRENGILVITIPYNEGWEIYVDGIQSPIIKSNFGFMGVEISPGYHELSMNYNRPFKVLGYIVSTSGILFFILFYKFFISANKNRKGANV